MNTKVSLAPKKWITIAADAVKQYPDGINQIYQEQLEGMIIKNVFSGAEMLRVQQELESPDLKTYDVRYGATLGQILVAKGNDLSAYWQQAKLFRTAIKSIFQTDFEAKVEALFSQMSGGRKIELPTEKGHAYSPATIRLARPQQGGIPPHTGNEFLDDSAYDYLKTIAKVINGLSYFIVINKPEKGGELVVYDLPPEVLNKQETELEKIVINKQNLEQYPQRQIVPDVGDMVIFKGGNIMHKVADILGDKTRITIGGFLALSQDESKIYYWS